VDDVVLEVDVPPGRGDRFEPRRVVLARIAQQPNGVAGNERRPRRAGERLIRESADARARGLRTYDGRQPIAP
jgi:hypothetical protein